MHARPSRSGHELWRFWLGLLLVELGGVVLAWLCTPALVNGDGLGYLKASVEAGPPYPGHLGYLPLLRAIAVCCGVSGMPADRLLAARLLSLAGGVVAAAALALWARRHSDERAGWLAAAGLWASAGPLAAFADVETYGVALAAVTVALASTEIAWLAAMAATAAVLFHVENVLLLIPLWFLRRRVAVAVAAVVAVIYGVLIAAHGLLWLLGAGHGFVQTRRWLLLPKAIYGAGKTLVYAPYPYQASWPMVLGSSLAGVVLLGVLCWCWRRPLSRAATWAWLLPYGAVGAAFFGSEVERWLFLLPLLWLGVATGTRRRLAATVIGLLVAGDLVFLMPAARDHQDLDAARAAGTLVRDGDLVVSPGHGWDEYVGFVARRNTVPFPIVYHTALVGAERMTEALHQAIAAARADHRRVLLVRFPPSDKDDPMGWKELGPLGITRANIDRLLPAGTRVPLGPSVDELR